MSWPSIWQAQNQSQGAGVQTPTANVGMFQLTTEQQYALQQQNWQQWQLYQTQFAQWQAQYGERYQQLQNDLMGTQSGVHNMVPNAFMQNIAPPLPVDYQPPPPPPPQQQTQENVQSTGVAQSSNQASNTPQEQTIKEPQPTISHMPLSTNQNEPSNNTQSHSKIVNYEQSNYSHQNQDGFRRNNRWNNNDRSNRPFGGTHFNNRNTFECDEPTNMDGPGNDRDYGNEEKSQEEIAFDVQFRKWEESFMEWKRNNANHPDQGQYNDFVTKMEVCRKQLTQRRETLRQKRLDSNHAAQAKQKNQPTKPEVENESLEGKQESKMVGFTDTTSGFGQGSSSFLTIDRSGSESGIPGLDLVGGNVPKTDPNIVAHVNNILGNPEIKSLLSNLQKQQNESEQTQFQQNNDNSNENDFKHGSNMFNRFGNEGRFEKLQNNDMPQQNPFRNKNQDDSDLPRYQSRQFEENPKRGRFWNENSSGDMSSFDRDRSTFSQEQNQNDDPGHFKNNRKRPRDAETFNTANKNVCTSQNDIEEFRAIQVIDYQNRSQNQTSFSETEVFSERNSTNNVQQGDYFPRKIIEYDHKSKVHPWNWFCPVIQIEYNHTKTGRSLHEHPPPQLIELKHSEPHRPKNESKEEFRQLRQPRWAQERQDRFSHGTQGQQYHSRYENRQSMPPVNAQPTEPYYRRNTQEPNWIRNNRERNNPQNSQNNHSYDRHSRTEDSTLPNTSSSYHRYDTAAKVEPTSKFNLKDLLFLPGRKTRPKKIVIVMRGVPGSGKSFISKAIKEKEHEMGGSARILSIDDYFMIESETDTVDPKRVSYEYDPGMEETYAQCLLKSFKKTLLDNLYDCIIVDCKNTTLQYLTEFHSISKLHFFTPFICELPLDLDKCLKNNIHNRTESDIRKAINEWVPTPSSYTILDYECLFNSADNTEEISDIEDQKDDVESLDAISEDNNSNATENEHDNFSDTGGDDEPIEFGVFKSKWDNDTTENKLARLDGTNKPMKHTTIEDYLQMDGWEPPPTSTNGKKRVRWADIEEKREQDKQRAIGFVVGQTNWNHLIDQPRDHSLALTKVKYIEKIRKN